MYLAVDASVAPNTRQVASVFGTLGSGARDTYRRIMFRFCTWIWFGYAAAAWGPRLSATQKNKIEVMQNQAARVITAFQAQKQITPFGGKSCTHVGAA